MRNRLSMPSTQLTQQVVSTGMISFQLNDINVEMNVAYYSHAQVNIPHRVIPLYLILKVKVGV